VLQEFGVPNVEEVLWALLVSGDKRLLGALPLGPFSECCMLWYWGPRVVLDGGG
jgi:hypothetical protein